MHSYIIAKVISINKKSVTIEKNYTGYILNTPNPDKLEVSKIKKFYLYKHMYINNKNSINEDLYGFIKYEQKEFFLNCLSVNGIGPKTAMNILKNDVSLLKKLIGSKDYKSLENLPGITKKYSFLLIDYLADLFEGATMAKTNMDIDGMSSALKVLGYTQDEIRTVINKVYDDQEVDKNDLSELVGLAIKLIAEENELKNC